MDSFVALVATVVLVAVGLLAFLRDRSIMYGYIIDLFVVPVVFGLVLSLLGWLLEWMVA
jgi:hypothetical protein